MKNLFCLSLILGFFGATAAFAQRDIGPIDVTADFKTTPIRVSADTSELNNLALVAFGAHGAYRLVASGYDYDVRFSLLAPAQVRVDVARASGQVIASETVAGTSTRNALLDAADIAVERTIGLHGFFASRLVFISERTGRREIYTSDLFFGGAQQLTHDGSLAVSPRWSPDGHRILYTGYFQSGRPDVFEMVNDNGGWRRETFASFQGTNGSAHFSPDGSRVALVLSGEGNPDIYVSNAEGREVSRRTRSNTAKASPCWSPDGTRLVFTSEPGPQLYLMSASGGTPQRIFTNISTYCAEPDWSRGDPNKLAFTIGAGRRFQIAVYDFSTRTSKQVSHAPYDAVSPCWLADGRHLIYTARTGGTSTIWILDTVSGKAKQLSPSLLAPASEASVWGP
ncbi:MAG TPA: biopolymer transporter Tol [Opitutaceae bacterium]|jgi:TolB protein|nr:biopolymer transporter Tol [Opitutaceae bacterium]